MCKSTSMILASWPQIAIFAAAILLCVGAGCVAEKESLHDQDHEEPEHWPSSLGDAAELIADRVAILSSQDGVEPEVAHKAEEELVDLIAWVPEIAADTELTEEQWLPIYELCEAIRGHMQTGDVHVADFAEDFDKLNSLLQSSQEAVQKMESEAYSALGTATQ